MIKYEDANLWRLLCFKRARWSLWLTIEENVLITCHVWMNEIRGELSKSKAIYVIKIFKLWETGKRIKRFLWQVFFGWWNDVNKSFAFHFQYQYMETEPIWNSIGGDEIFKKGEGMHDV